MTLEYTAWTRYELKAVQPSQRIIEGHAATFGNLDLNGDVIAPNAFLRTLATKAPSEIAVFIGHNTSGLPVGVPLEIREDTDGLFTRTQIFKTTAGDDLLATAKALEACGQPLGMSIGFQTKDAGWQTVNGKQVRLLKDIELMEYSFAAKQVIASPPALVTAVKRQTTVVRSEDPADRFARILDTGDRLRRLGMHEWKHGAVHLPSDALDRAQKAHNAGLRTLKYLKQLGTVHANNMANLLSSHQALLASHGHQLEGGEDEDYFRQDDDDDDVDRLHAGTDDPRFSGWR